MLDAARFAAQIVAMPQSPKLAAPPMPVRILFIVFGCVFGGIGLVVLGFLWTSEGFGAPPLVFRLFGSLIAIAFVAFGGVMVFSFVRPRSMIPTVDPSAASAVPFVGYTCPHCAATLDKDAEVSPLGDVKCTFCGRWFNIHNASA